MIHNAPEANTKKSICYECVRDAYLAREIARDGTPAVCSYCENEQTKTWLIDILADKVEAAFADHFVRTSDCPSPWDQNRMADPESDYVWYREGDQTIDVIQNAAGISREAAADVQKILEERHYDLDYAAMGEETEFALGAHYEQKNPDAAYWHKEWLSFERVLKFEVRFFSRMGVSHLDAIFNGIDTIQTTDNSPLVVEAGPTREIHHLYRARVFQSDHKLKEALCDPGRHLGPPPPEFASAGRMNSRGISVFYGATRLDTARAEVRPPVGSKVALARFAITRPLRLLDLTALENVRDDGSIFDPALKERLERIAFLRTLGKRVTRPVMPDDEAFDYLTTQAIADFLASESLPQLDGIIFSSTQSKEGQNVVLFHKAASVVKIDLPPGTVVESHTDIDTDEGPEIDYFVRELVPPMAPSTRDKSSHVSFQMGPIHSLDEDYREASLSIDLESVEVHHVEAVDYGCNSFRVARHRAENRDWKF